MASNPSSFEITIKGDASCIKEFFSGVSAVVEEQNRPQVIIAEGMRDLVPALSKYLEARAGITDGGLESADPTGNNDEVPQKALGIMEQFKNMLGGNQAAAPTSDATAAKSSVFDLKSEIEISADGSEKNRFYVKYNDNTREVAEEDHAQFKEFQELLTMIDATPEPVVNKLTTVVEEHQGDFNSLLERLKNSELATGEQELMTRSVKLINSAGSEIKSATLHLYLAGKLPSVVSKLALKYGSFANMGADTSRPSFSEGANTSSAPQDIMSKLPDLIGGVMGAFGNMGGGPAASSSRPTTPARSNGTVKKMLKRKR